MSAVLSAESAKYRRRQRVLTTPPGHSHPVSLRAAIPPLLFSTSQSCESQLTGWLCRQGHSRVHWGGGVPASPSGSSRRKTDSEWVPRDPLALLLSREAERGWWVPCTQLFNIHNPGSSPQFIVSPKLKVPHTLAPPKFDSHSASPKPTRSISSVCRVSYENPLNVLSGNFPCRPHPPNLLNLSSSSGLSTHCHCQETADFSKEPLQQPKCHQQVLVCSRVIPKVTRALRMHADVAQEPHPHFSI